MDPVAQPQGTRWGSLTSDGYLSPPPSKLHVSMGWGGVGGWVREKEGETCSDPIRAHGTGEDNPNIRIGIFLPPSTWVTKTRGERIFLEDIARMEGENQDLKTALTPSGLRKTGCWSLRIGDSKSFRTSLSQGSICSPRITPWPLPLPPDFS